MNKKDEILKLLENIDGLTGNDYIRKITEQIREILKEIKN